MSDPLIERLANALQEHRESTLRLQEIASELQDHCMRVRELDDRLEGTRVVLSRKEIAQTQAHDATMDMRSMPLVLRGGPQVRDG